MPFDGDLMARSNSKKERKKERHTNFEAKSMKYVVVKQISYICFVGKVLLETFGAGLFCICVQPD